MYEIVISYDVSCTCLFFANNDTLCKHLVWIMINKFNQKPDCSLLQQMHLTAEDLQGCSLTLVPLLGCYAFIVCHG